LSLVRKCKLKLNPALALNRTDTDRIKTKSNDTGPMTNNTQVNNG